LLQARAIENQCFVLAAAQWGQHNQGSRETWGHSCIVGPWGEVIAKKAEQVGWVSAKVDAKAVEAIRAKMPVAQHNRFSLPQLIAKCD